MDDYNDLKYDTYKIIDTFWLLISMGSKHFFKNDCNKN
jgi:hypothetical protein